MNTFQTFQTIVTTNKTFDLDGDGVNEFEDLEFLSFENPARLLSIAGQLMVVIVESRLFANLTGSRYTTHQLVQRLGRLKFDLGMEGHQTVFVKMKPYRGPRHQDGKTLLAIRELLKTVRQSFPNLEGVILVGSFPEASIARTWPIGPDEYPGGYKIGGPLRADDLFKSTGLDFAPKRYEIVLADLDGNWRDLYHEKVSFETSSFKLTPSTTVATSDHRVILTNSEIQTVQHSLEDVFLIRDESVNITGATAVLDMKCRDPEASTVDRQRPNPVSRPDICVSRIDARHVAVMPPDARLLDANGKPQRTSSIPPIDFSFENWGYCPILERTLLVEYLDRNHAFRYGAFSDRAFDVKVIESRQLGTGTVDVGLDGLAAPRSEVRNANLLDFIRWTKASAALRAYSSHADCRSTELCEEDDGKATLAESEAGGHPWRWIEENGQYVPTFRGHCHADFHVYRTLWENKQLANVPPSLALHVGCDVNGASYPWRPYDDDWYAKFQNAETMLFYGNQLAVLCHATWWNEGPYGFGAAFGSTHWSVIGDGWKAISERVSNDDQLARRPTQRKQNYIWSVVGDWTLQKRYALFLEPEVTLALASFGLTAGGWRVDQHPRFLADLTGDGRADIVGFGNGGVWVALNNGDGTFRPPQMAISGFGYDAGGWRVDQHPRFLADLRSSGAADIVGFGNGGVWVALNNGDGTFMQPQQVLGQFGYDDAAGGWRVDQHPRFLADLTGDGRADIVGFGNGGVWVALNNGKGTFKPPQMVISAFGYDAGGWRVDQHPRFLADLTGNGRADIVGFGNGGVWVALNNGKGTFKPPQMVISAFGYDAGGWRVDQHPRFLADLTGSGAADIVGFGNAGVWVALNNGDGTFMQPQQVLGQFGYNDASGGWRVDRHPRFLADLTGDGRADIVGFGNGGVWVALNNGDGTFMQPQQVLGQFGYNDASGGWRVDQHPRFLADLTGNRRADIVGFGSPGVWVALNKLRRK